MLPVKYNEQYITDYCPGTSTEQHVAWKLFHGLRKRPFHNRGDMYMRTMGTTSRLSISYILV
jgi:hypothetical protein